MKKLLTSIAILAIALSPFCDAEAQNIYTMAGIAPTGSYTGDGNYAVLAHVNGPSGIAVTHAGDVYICDARNFRVRKINAAGIISTVAGTGATGSTGDGGPATNARLNPTGIAVDRYGNLFITDVTNINVRKVDTAGIITTIAGTGTAGYSGDGGAATAASINGANGIAVDTAGNVFISDARNFVVREISTSGIINTIAGTGTTGYSGDGGAATAAALGRPVGLALKADGTLFIADNFNNVIRKINPSGTISTYAGTGTAGYSGDGGPATAARMTPPAGIALDSAGNLYIVDGGNNVIREVTPAGTISTFAGNGTPGYSGDGGAAINAKLNGPTWVAADAASNVYISDIRNNVIRKVGTAVRSITITSDTHDTVCAGITMHFTATAYADATPHYKWQVNGVTHGSDSSGFTYSSYTSGSTIRCFLLDTAGGSNLAVSNTLVADTAPVRGTLVGFSPICIGSNATFIDSAAGAGAGGLGGGIWTLTDTSIARFTTNPPNGRVRGLIAGTDTLIYTISNICGSAVISKIITVVPNPIGHISGPATVCSGSTSTYTDTSAGGIWRVRPNMAGTIDASGNFTAGPNPGPAFISYAINPACAILDTVIIDTVPVVPPIAGPTSVNTLFLITLTDPAAGGTWSSSDTTIAKVDAVTGVVQGITVGTVTITYSVTTTICTGINTYTVTVVNASGIRNIANSTAFNISPNPATNAINISWAMAEAGNGRVSITDITGREVYSTEMALNTPNGAHSIDIAALSKGIYLLSVKAGNSSYTTKLVKE